MLDLIINPDNWQLLSLDEQVSLSNNDDEEQKDIKVKIWRNSPQLISPLSFYKYLKAKFGPPNGLVMFFKTHSSDNLIHWQYSLKAAESFINIWGKTSGIEITIKADSIAEMTMLDWEKMIANIQNNYRDYSKEISDINSGLEHWSLFINPFSRIEHTVRNYVYQLEKLKLQEPKPYTVSTEESLNKYMKELKRWTKNISKAAALGTTIRMLCPVVAEAFINLVLLVFRKEEYVNDERLYENLIRQQIDIRVKTLHLHCTCFPNKIDSESLAFKEFHTLMNKRNDFLHGNIDPNKLIVEDVWFDQRYIPLFKNDEGIIKKTFRNYCTNVEPEKAINDFQTISNLIELVLMSMDDNSLKSFIQIMADRMPGVNKKTKRLGVLFPPEYLVESYLTI